MDNPTDTAERPRWQLDHYRESDAAPTAYPMSDDNSTACTGVDPGPDEGEDETVLPADVDIDQLLPGVTDG